MPERPSRLPLVEKVDSCCDRYEADFRAGHQPRIEAFIKNADDTVRPALLRALLELDIELRKRAGETPLASDYDERFPADRSTIRSIFDEASRPESLVSSVKLTEVETSRLPRVKAGSARPAPAAPPGRIARFEIRTVLGEGAFGTVYQAHDPQLDRDVALKVPRFSGQQSQEERERFLREARAAAGLHHAHICPVHEVGTIDGRDYIVLAFIDGKPLSRLLQTRPKLSERQIAAVIRKLALALQEAHDQGIIHRDLKPGNIMINRKGEPVIMDFGLARRDKSGDAQISQSGQIMGTPAYMSPEQARGDGKGVGPASDIYSLGIVLYELLCGRRPFEGTVTEVIGQILHVEAPQPSRFRADIDPRLQAICMRAIAKNPDARFTCMKDFAAALADFTRAAPGEVRSAAPAIDSRKEAATNQFVDLLAAISSDVESKVERAVTKAGRNHRVPWWPYLAGSAVMGLIVLLGILFFVRKDTVTVIVNIPIENINDPALSFLLDDKPIAATAFAAPIELAPGKHELLVNQDGKLFRRFLFEVGTKQTDPVVVQDVTPLSPVIPQPADGFLSIFNGKDLTGWTPESDDPENWKVQDQAITAIADDGQPLPGAETWLLSDREYQDFLLRFEFRALSETVNSGFGYRVAPGEKPPAGTGTYAVPSHLQFEVFEDPVRRANGTLATGTLIGSLGPLLSIQPHSGSTQKPKGEWNRIEVESRGQSVRVQLNGTELVKGSLDDLIARGATYPGLRRKSGRIAFQRLRGTVQFRDIQIKELEPADDGWVDLFNGKDFAGWNNPGRSSVDQGWAVRDGAIVRDKANPNDVPGGTWQRNNLWTQKRFEDFILELEFRGTGMNTLVLRADQPKNVYSDRGLHVPMNMRGTPRHDWRLGTFYPFKSPSNEPGVRDGWNHLRLTAVGPKISVQLNGETINEIDLDRWSSEQSGKIDPDLLTILKNLSRDGHIGFNAREGEISLRNIRIRELRKELAARDVDPDRKAAESLLALGRGFVKVNGQDRQIHQVSGLPTERFHLTGAYFADVKGLDDDALAVLKDCVHLTELDLRSTRVSEKGLEIFRGRTNFTSLGLAYLRVTDTGLEIFRGNKALKSLFLHDTFLTDKGLSLFHDCKELGTLWIGGTPITDAGMLPFRECRFLKWLDVRATKVTREGVQTIKAALPACRVDADPDKR